MKKSILLVTTIVIISLIFAACDESTAGDFSGKTGNGVTSGNEVSTGNEDSTENSLSAGNTAGNGTVNEGQIMVVTPGIKGNSATLSVGDVLVIEIPTIPSEGWTWVPDQLDTSILEQVGEAEYIAGSDPNDAGGIFRLNFKAIGAGSTNLTLLYVNAPAGPGDSAEGVAPGMSSNSFGMAVVVNGGRTFVITPAPTGNSATLKTGDLLVIEIPTIPSEGWTWVTDKLDTTILEQVGEAVYTAGTDANNAGGIYRLEFRAVGRGSLQLTLLYVKVSVESSESTMSSNSFGMAVIVN